MKAVNEYLGTTAQEHEDYKQRLYLNWCENNSKDVVQWQLIMANSAINRWWLYEMNKFEADFISKVARYEGSSTVTKVDHKKCYHKCVTGIFEIYPSGLIDATRPKEMPGMIRLMGPMAITALNRN